MWPAPDPTRSRRRGGRRVTTMAALVAAAVTAAVALTVPIAAAQTTPTLSASPGTLPADRPTTVTVTGRSYLVPPHAPGANVSGGVYVLFGWVAPGTAWGPSARNAQNSDGQFGTTYSYAGEAGSGETRDDGDGSNRFVSFTAGGVSGTSTAFHMDDAGNWATTITVPGATYEWFDPATGRRATVDCRVVQCGIFTVGAHGRASATNERFAPLTFTTGSLTPTTVGGGTPGAGGSTGGTASPSAAPAAGSSGGSSGGSSAGSSAGSSGTTPATARRGTGAGTAAPTTAMPVDPTVTSPAGDTTTSAPPVAEPTEPTDATEATNSTDPADAGERNRNRAGATERTPSGREVIEIRGDDGAGSGWLLAGGGTAAVGATAVALWVLRRSAGP